MKLLWKINVPGGKIIETKTQLRYNSIMKITPRMLLITAIGLGLLMLGYALLRQFTGLALSEGTEQYIYNIFIIALLGIYFYNRKLAADRKKQKTGEKNDDPPDAKGS
jgi:hypothetical protein